MQRLTFHLCLSYILKIHSNPSIKHTTEYGAEVNSQNLITCIFSNLLIFCQLQLGHYRYIHSQMTKLNMCVELQDDFPSTS